MDARARRRFQAALHAAEDFLKAAEVSAKSGIARAVVNSSHAAVHNAVVAYLNLRIGRSGRLAHREVEQRALRAGIVPDLVRAVGAVEKLYAPVTYGGPAPSSEEATATLQAARKVLEFVHREAKRMGAEEPGSTRKA